MRKVAFYTLGCKVNQQESAGMRMLFEQAGYVAVPFEEQADVYVINTCTVTQVSDKKSRQAISRAHARGPQAMIVVVGCYAQQSPEQVRALPGVDIVVGTQHRDRLVELIEEKQNGAVQDIQAAREFESLPAAIVENRTRTQLKIQDGCDRFCSYCIIPFARGPVRSLRITQVQVELQEMSRVNVSEVVLTGIHLMSYGKDLPERPSLARVIGIATLQPGIGRVRLGSLDPALIDEAFVDAISALPSGKLCAQFHLSLQSGSEAVLARMNRRYTKQGYRDAVGRLRHAFANCAITTDIIAGFPGETEQEHMETMDFVQEIGFARVHVFPYSRRPGTKAANMPGQIDKAQKENRARALIQLGEELEHIYLKAQVGSVQIVLFECCEGGWSEGYAGNYVRVRVPGSYARRLLPVNITGYEKEFVVGQVL